MSSLRLAYVNEDEEFYVNSSRHENLYSHLFSLEYDAEVEALDKKIRDAKKPVTLGAVKAAMRRAEREGFTVRFI